MKASNQSSLNLVITSRSVLNFCYMIWVSCDSCMNPNYSLSHASNSAISLLTTAVYDLSPSLMDKCWIRWSAGTSDFWMFPNSPPSIILFACKYLSSVMMESMSDSLVICWTDYDNSTSSFFDMLVLKVKSTKLRLLILFKYTWITLRKNWKLLHSDDDIRGLLPVPNIALKRFVILLF